MLDGSNMIRRPNTFTKSVNKQGKYLVKQFSDENIFKLFNAFTDKATATLHINCSNRRKIFSGYIAIQFGLTAFRAKDENTQNFNYRSYNFFVFPQLRKQRFECQGESIAFLGSNNFDFNTLFREGISYCDEDEAKRLREQFQEKLKLMESCDNKNNVEEQVVAVPIEEQEQLDRLK